MVASMGVPVKPTYVALGKESAQVFGEAIMLDARFLDDNLFGLTTCVLCASSEMQMTFSRSVSRPNSSVNF
ncbi:MAG: hypothetical protein U0V48_16700 [Anaerolineales bacterium]